MDNGVPHVFDEFGDRTVVAAARKCGAACQLNVREISIQWIPGKRDVNSVEIANGPRDAGNGMRKCLRAPLEDCSAVDHIMTFRFCPAQIVVSVHRERVWAPVPRQNKEIASKLLLNLRYIAPVVIDGRNQQNRHLFSVRNHILRRAQLQPVLYGNEMHMPEPVPVDRELLRLYYCPIAHRGGSGSAHIGMHDPRNMFLRIGIALVSAAVDNADFPVRSVMEHKDSEHAGIR